jgi:hypothetical protein
MCQAFGNWLFQDRIIFTKGVTMSYNLTEQARKDAGLPGFVRSVPTNPVGRNTVTGEMFARFKEAVDKRVGFLIDELNDCREAKDKLRDQIAKLSQEKFDLTQKQWANQASDRVRQVAETLDIPANDQKRLVESVQ